MRFTGTDYCQLQVDSEGSSAKRSVDERQHGRDLEVDGQVDLVLDLEEARGFNSRDDLFEFLEILALQPGSFCLKII